MDSFTYPLGYMFLTKNGQKYFVHDGTLEKRNANVTNWLYIMQKLFQIFKNYYFVKLLC